MPKSLVLSFCYQIELYLPWNALFIRDSRKFLSLRTPTLHFFSKLTCKNFLFRRFRDTALFFFPFLSGLKKPCVRTFPDARLLIFFSMFLCLFLMFSLVLRMNRIFWFLQRGLSKKCQRGVLKNMWIIQTPLRTAFHDLNEKLNSSCGY